MNADSGIPVDWLTWLPAGIVHLHCVCPGEIAAERFVRRKRHSGQCNGARPEAEIAGLRDVARDGVPQYRRQGGRGYFECADLNAVSWGMWLSRSTDCRKRLENNPASRHYVSVRKPSNAYDIALKSILRRLSGNVLREITGLNIARWHNVELPVVQNLRADMLGETADGQLLHIELQSGNDAQMASRMLEYAAAINRQMGRLPQQLVLYVGRERMRMKCEVIGPEWAFRCRMADIRELDGDKLIDGGNLEDNVIAVLARLHDKPAAVRRILRRIASCAPDLRTMAYQELLLLSDLRGLEPVIDREMKRMPITEDIMKHATLGPMIRRSMATDAGLSMEEHVQKSLNVLSARFEKRLEKNAEIGLEMIRRADRREGLEEGERRIILRQIGQRFGPVPPSVRKKIKALPGPKLEQISLRLLNASSLTELLR